MGSTDDPIYEVREFLVECLKTDDKHLHKLLVALQQAAATYKLYELAMRDPGQDPTLVTAYQESHEIFKHARRRVEERARLVGLNVPRHLSPGNLMRIMG